MNYLTKRQALHAMTEFLETFYWIPSLKDKNDPSSNVGTFFISNILSSIDTTIWLDGSTGDPAAWDDWLDSINYVLKDLNESEPENGKISLKVAFISMRKYLHFYYSLSFSADDIVTVLYDTRFFEGELVNKEVWNNYLHAANTVLMDTNRYK